MLEVAKQEERQSSEVRSQIILTLQNNRTTTGLPLGKHCHFKQQSVTTKYGNWCTANYNGSTAYLLVSRKKMTSLLTSICLRLRFLRTLRIFNYIMAGRPAAPRSITPVVLPAAQLTGIDVTPRDLYAVHSDKREWLQWLSTKIIWDRTSEDCRKKQIACLLTFQIA